MRALRRLALSEKTPNVPALDRSSCPGHCLHGQMRAADVAQLGQIAAGYRSRERFLTELTLDPPDATSGRAGADLKDEDYTVLSTIHSAKGQEWRIVRILNAVDGCIPSDRATGTSEEIEEERRLLYVAMTRAKDELDVIVPQRFFTHQQAKLARFASRCTTSCRPLWPWASASECSTSAHRTLTPFMPSRTSR
jgi:superfamily I DNA/RNA helicase